MQPEMVVESPITDIRENDLSDRLNEGPWIVIVWDDPINLMSYVTWVFQKLFGYPYEVAHRLMMKVHTEGKAVVAHGSKETSELNVAKLHSYGLWATMEPSR